MGRNVGPESTQGRLMEAENGEECIDSQASGNGGREDHRDLR